MGFGLPSQREAAIGLPSQGAAVCFLCSRNLENGTGLELGVVVILQMCLCEMQPSIPCWLWKGDKESCPSITVQQVAWQQAEHGEDTGSAHAARSYL